MTDTNYMTTITLSVANKRRLEELGKKSETFDEIVGRLLDKLEGKK